MKDQFVLLLNNSFLNSGIPRISGQFTADQTFHYKESALYLQVILSLYLPKSSIATPASKVLFGSKEILI